MYSTMDLLLWAEIDDFSVPYVYRSGERNVAVRMVEQQLLYRYPRQFMKTIEFSPALATDYMNITEVELFNASGVRYRGKSAQPYTTKDLMIKLDDFEKFYDVLKERFRKMKAAANPKSVKNVPKLKPLGAFDPPVDQHKVKYDQEESALKLNTSDAHGGGDCGTCSLVPKSMTHSRTNHKLRKTHADVLKAGGGWVQVNNTVVPFVYREDARFIPKSVLKHAANIYVKTKTEKNKVSPREQQYLNYLCSKAKIKFDFSKKTELISLTNLCRYSSGIKFTAVLPPGCDPLNDGIYKDCPSFMAVSGENELLMDQEVTSGSHLESMSSHDLKMILRKSLNRGKKSKQMNVCDYDMDTDTKQV